MSHSEPQKPTLARGRKNHLLRTLLDSWPLLVWLGVLALTINFFRQGVSFRQMNGTVGVYQESVAALDTGRIADILVQPGDNVEKGQIVAQLDTRLIDQKLKKRKDEIAADRLDRIRRYEGDIHKLEEDVRKYSLDQAEDSAELSARKDELDERKNDVANNRITPDVIDKIKVAIARLKAKVDLYPGYIEALDSRITAARAALQAVEAEDPDTDASGVRSTELDILLERKEEMTLRAVHAGSVYRVEKEPGEVVNAGETVVRVVAKPENIVGFLPQEKVDVVNIGDHVWVASTSSRHTYHESKVIAISPRMSNTPDRASPLPNKMLRGREVTIALPPGVNFLPGQTVIIDVSKPGEVPFFVKFFQSE